MILSNGYLENPDDGKRLIDVWDEEAVEKWIVWYGWNIVVFACEIVNTFDLVEFVEHLVVNG